MTHYDRDYSSLATNEEKDAAAIKDVFDYIGDNQKMRDAVMYALGQADGDGTATGFKGLNFALGFVGISGYPVHALGRKYALGAFRAWMHEGKDRIPTDEKGYPIEEGDVLGFEAAVHEQINDL